MSDDQLSFYDDGDDEEPLPDPGEDTIGAFHAPDKGAPETERLAALREYPRTGTKRLAVLLTLRHAEPNGLSDYEGSVVSGIYLYTYAPRRVELRDGGWVEDSGVRRKVPRSRTPAAVWRLSKRARREFGLDDGV